MYSKTSFKELAYVMQGLANLKSIRWSGRLTIQAKDNAACLRHNFFYITPQFLFLRPLTDWMRPIYINYT